MSLNRGGRGSAHSHSSVCVTFSQNPTASHGSEEGFTGGNSTQEKCFLISHLQFCGPGDRSRWRGRRPKQCPWTLSEGRRGCPCAHRGRCVTSTPSSFYPGRAGNPQIWLAATRWAPRLPSRGRSQPETLNSPEAVAGSGPPLSARALEVSPTPSGSTVWPKALCKWREFLP